MTAEIAIMNKEAIALAADSAVTMQSQSGQKIFTSANKLFTLSKYHPVGIMIYGSAILMGVPWETIIKIYRTSLRKKRFDTLQDYAKDMINFLDNNNSLFPDSVQNEYVTESITAYFHYINKDIQESLQKIISEKGKFTEKQVGKVVSETIKAHYAKWHSTANIGSIPETFNDTIENEHSKLIAEAIKEVFQKLPLSSTDLTQLKEIAGSLFSKFPNDIKKQNMSGAVIAGFGHKDTFPQIESFEIECVVKGRLKYREPRSKEIDFNTSASIIPFAQSEMVRTFMEGSDPFYRNIEETYLSKLFSEYSQIVAGTLDKYTAIEKKALQEKLKRISKEVLKEHGKQLRDYRQKEYINPVIKVVSMLPKDELAAMAESLVNLTSFKRKVSMERETVGGPIDVAVISKGDGFIWVKRKHYFKAELNPQFFANYYRGELDEIDKRD